VKKNYQRKERKSNHKFEVVRGQELLADCRSYAPSWKTKSRTE